MSQELSARAAIDGEEVPVVIYGPDEVDGTWNEVHYPDGTRNGGYDNMGRAVEIAMWKGNTRTVVVRLSGELRAFGRPQ